MRDTLIISTRFALATALNAPPVVVVAGPWKTAKPLHFMSTNYNSSVERRKNMSIFELTSKVNDLRELRRMADELTAEIEALQDSIKEHMTAAGVDTINGPDFKITWKAITSARFDTAAFKKDNPEIAAAYTKTTTARRFTLA